ncbi:hypothetical protein CL689_03065, partial [Candidatus Saccharibacteria bacterium]|nr:hypothetical protein [Candidatus Saccharibacteria bacterium]
LAENYGKPFGEKPKVTEVCLRLRNPFEPAKWEHVYGAPWVQKWIDFWRKEEGWIDRDSGAEMDDDQVLQMISDTRLYHYEENGLKLSERWDDFLRTAADHHDGFMGDDPTDRAFILVAFESNQIKSPSLNSGEFSLKDPSIDR